MMHWCDCLSLLIVITVQGCLVSIEAREARRTLEEEIRLREVANFMTKYKYLEGATPPASLVSSTEGDGGRQVWHSYTAPPNKKQVGEKLKQLQLYMRIPTTGRIDDATMEAIKRPRCGRPDPEIDVELQQTAVVAPGGGNSARGRSSPSGGDANSPSAGNGPRGGDDPERDTGQGGGTGRPGGRRKGRRRPKRYSIAGDRWNKRHITYSVLSYPTSVWIPRKKVQDSMTRALQMWGDVTPLDFRMLDDYADEEADIYVSFSKYRHGDPYPFDGPDGTIAHAYLPNGQFGELDGDVHFDDSEYFSYDGDSGGYNLFKVAAHELGHSLGLEHSHIPGSIMVPDYSGFKGGDDEFKLGEDDIRAIQVLYGDPDQPRYKGNPKAECNKAYDAAAVMDGVLYLFKDRRFWRVKRIGKVLSPRKGEKIKRRFPKLPPKIDAIYQRKDGHIVALKGYLHWVYKGKQLLPGYPRTMRSRNMPGRIDAAMHIRPYNKTYLFRGPFVWRYDEKREYVDGGFPTLSKNVFMGIETPIDAAFQYTDKNSYFIQRKKYQRYSQVHRNADPGFPRYFGEDFIAC